MSDTLDFATLSPASNVQKTGSPEVAKARPAAKSSPMRPAKPSDLDLVHQRLIEAIDTSPFYSPLFKEYEKGRLSRGYLRNLVAMDPNHVMIAMSKNETAGFMISGPELGTLWLYWSYIFPEKRRATLAMASLRSFIEHWDNGRFHKIATYTRPDNKTAIAMMKRFRFKHVCTLEKHIFGEDYMHWERALTKSEPGYDFGMGPGLAGRLKRRIARFAGR